MMMMMIETVFVSLLCVNISKSLNMNLCKTKPKLKQSEISGSKNSMLLVCVFIFTAIF